MLHRGLLKDGVWILGAVVPAVIMAIAAMVALAPGQVRAEVESEPEAPDVVICDGLHALTMGVNTMTLHRMGTLTKHSHSSDRECRMSLTLIDVSSDDAPADNAKVCTVTATPTVTDSSIDVDESRVGDCSTVEAQIEVLLPDSIGAGPPSDGVSGQSSRTAYGEMSGYEQFGLRLFTSGVYVHYVVAGNTGTVGAYTTWRAEKGPFPSTYARWDHRRYPGNSGTARYTSNQWAKYVSAAGAYSTNNVIVTVTGQGYVSCRFSTIGFRGDNLLNRFHYHRKVCGTR